MTLRNYLRCVGIAIDQLLNTLFCGFPDETISSRWGRAKGIGKIAALGCKLLDHLEHDHCEIAIEFDKDGKPRAHHLGEGWDK